MRALLSLGMILGLAQTSTMAAWTDSATVPSQQFQSGSLDLMVGAAAGDQLAGEGGTWTHATLGLTDMAPGESVARPLTVTNAGSVPLTLTGHLKATDENLSPSLRLTLSAGGIPSNTGQAGDNTRSGTCTGGTATLVSGHAVTTSPIEVEPAQTLTPGVSRTYCVRVELDASAPNSLQGETTSLRFSFGARQ